MDKPLGLGIIGLHHQHPRWYHPLWSRLPQYELRAVAEPDEPFLHKENEFFRLAAYADYRALLERQDIDVVIVWLEHSRMPAAVEAAAAAGKHVIVEKPGAADVAGVQSIVQTARRFPRIKISSPYCWRNHPVSARIRAAVQAGRLGRIVAMEGRLNAGRAYRYVRDQATWMLKAEEGGGPMWNLGVHWIDYFRWMTGREVVAVSGAVSGPFGEPPRTIEDTAQAVLTFDDGAIAMLEASYSMPDSYPGARDIYVALRGLVGDAIWAPAWLDTTDELLLVSDHESVGPNRCQRLKIASENISGYGGQMAWSWLAEFAQAVRQDRPAAVTPEDMLAAVQVADAFYRSVNSGQREPAAPRAQP